jgi:ribosomal-protein-serine acetyltransferase
LIIFIFEPKTGVYKIDKNNMVREIIVDNNTILKQLQIEDAEIIFSAIDHNRKHLSYWLPFVDQTKSVKDTFTFVKSIVDGIERRQEIFTVWHCNEFAGLIGLKDIDYLNQKLEIGYWLIEKMTGKGIVTTSVEKLLPYSFSKLDMNRVQIKCGIGNEKSSAIPKRLGFVFEGIERQGEKHLNRFIDLEIFSLLKKEWID